MPNTPKPRRIKYLGKDVQYRQLKSQRVGSGINQPKSIIVVHQLVFGSIIAPYHIRTHVHQGKVEATLSGHVAVCTVLIDDVYCFECRFRFNTHVSYFSTFSHVLCICKALMPSLDFPSSFALIYIQQLRDYAD